MASDVPVEVTQALEILCKTPKRVLQQLFRNQAGNLELRTLGKTLAALTNQSCLETEGHESLAGDSEPNSEFDNASEEHSGRDSNSGEDTEGEIEEDTADGSEEDTEGSRGKTSESGDSGRTSRPEDPSKSAAKEILSTLYSKIEDVKKLLAETPLAAIGASLYNGDPRIIDLRDKCDDLSDQLRRGLSQISLANEYSSFQKGKYSYTTLGRIINDWDYALSRRGNITEFINERKYATKEENAIRRAITNGIKLLALQACVAEFPKIVLFCILFYSKFRGWTYKNIASVVEILRDEQQDKNGDFMTVIGGKDDGWVSTAISHYEGNDPRFSLCLRLY